MKALANVMLPWIVGLLLITSCEPEMVDPYEVFMIPKGKHQKNFPVQTLQSTALTFKAIFDETATYEAVEPVNQYDIHKLMGFSDCNSHHHDNSARFGWRWMNDSLEIHSYVYNEGVRVSEYIGTIGLGEEHFYSLLLMEDSYVFTLDNRTLSMPRTKNCDKGIFYMLFPFFGGNEVAPHDIIIKVQILY